MVKTFVFGLTVLALPVVAGPVFIDRSDALDVPQVYAGGWEHFVGGGVATFDCNGDHLPEILAAGGTEPTRLYVNQTPDGGALAFAEVSDFPVLDAVTGAYPLDIDSDGLMDLAILRVGENVLLRGLGGCRFAPGDWGFESADRWTTAFSATWEAGAEFPTLAFGNYVDRSDPDGPFEACDANRIYRHDGTGYGQGFALEPGFCPLSILFSDPSRRGQADLRLSNDRHYYVRGGGEQVWRPDENRFLGEADGWAQVSIWGMGIASRDISGDGYPDVMLTSMGDQLLQLSDGPGRWVAAPFGIGTYAQRPHTGADGRPSTGWHAQFGDVDNDGLSDLFIAKGNVDQMPGNAMADPNNLLMQGTDGVFTEASVKAGVADEARSRGGALVDLNRDGRLDLVVVNRRAAMRIYENVTEAVGTWVSVELRQPAPNVAAVGAWIELETPKGARQMREITIGGGHAGGQAGPEHFGLGTAGRARLRVIWPGGVLSDWVTVGVNQEIRLERETGTGLRPMPPQ